MRDEMSQREDDIEKLQVKVDDLRREKQNFDRLSVWGKSQIMAEEILGEYPFRIEERYDEVVVHFQSKLNLL